MEIFLHIVAASVVLFLAALAALATDQKFAPLTDPLYLLSAKKAELNSDSIHYTFERSAFKMEDSVYYRLYIRDGDLEFMKILYCAEKDLWRKYIDPKKPVTFVMSTLLSSSTDVWPKQLGRLMHSYTNFIRIDWKYAILDRGLGTEFIPGVGQNIGEFILLLREMFPKMPIYMIGFGAGAHGLAIAARYSDKYDVDAFFALDPVDGLVEPRYLHPDVSLDGEDAKYVQIIQTTVWGTDGIEAHDVFRVNSGVTQPGCDDPSKYKTIACSSFQAVRLFAASLNKSRPIFDKTGKVKLGFWAQRNVTGCHHHKVDYDF